MNAPILEVKNLTIEFAAQTRRIRAVSDVSLSLEAGKVLGIVGESGSGKSTTALAIMRLLPKSAQVSGAVNFQPRSTAPAVNLLSLPESAMERVRGGKISMIFQDPLSSLNPVYTCGSQIIEAIRLHKSVSGKEAHRRALALLDEVKLPQPKAMMKRYPYELSGGQIQRVMIAMALAVNPSVLIADEPTTALDVTIQATILQLLREIRDRRQMSILFITHDLSVVAAMADAIAVLYRGKLMEYNAAQQIFTHPHHPYTKGLLACRPRLEQRLKYLPTVSDFMEETVSPSGEILLREKPKPPLSDAIEITVAEHQQRLFQLQTQASLLQVKNLCVFFPVRGLFGKTVDFIKAVNAVSFEVYPGETLGLVGESGCGKTTLGRSLLRLIEPTAGQIWFEGQDITHLPQARLRSRRREMQMIFQDPFSALDSRMTVAQSVTEPLRIHTPTASLKQRQEQAVYSLDRVGLSADFLSRYPHELSGGQCQRVCIARALALHPKFIICDESVSALDVSVQAQVLNLLRKLQDEFQLTYIFISHDLSVVRFLSDRILVMNQGAIVESGSAESVFRSPANAYTRQLLQATPTVDATFN